MACPKRRKSKMRQKMRQFQKRWKAPILKSCSSCGAAIPSHVACPSCGYYGERQVLDVQAVG